jgi:hypothetical protein
MRPRPVARLAISAAWTALAAVACGGEPAAPNADPSLLEAFDSLWTRYDRIYPYFSHKGVDWNAARSQFRPAAANARTAAELADITHRMLGPLRDVHAWTVTPSGATIPSYTPQAFVNWRRSVWDAQLQQHDRRNQAGRWGYAWFGRVPYVYFESWGADFSPAAFDAALDEFRESPGLIIDVRMNGGGSDALAFKVANRFFDQSRTFAYVRYRMGNGHDDFTSALARTGTPGGAWQFVKPTLLLVGRGSFSSTESFVLALGVLPNVTVVGDTTGGGSGNPATFMLAGGWSYSLPRWIEYDSEMRVIEWSGIAPDRVIPASVADFDAGRDPVLDFARAWAAAR